MGVLALWDVLNVEAGVFRNLDLVEADRRID